MEYKENVKKIIDDNTNQALEVIQQKIEIWSNHVVFSSLWWFGVVLSILPWLIWIKYRKKDSTDKIKAILFAIFSACIAEPFFHWGCSDWMEIFLFLTYTHHNIFTCTLPK